MADPAKGNTVEALRAEIEILKARASTSVSPCDVAKFIAVTNEEVVSVLMRHLAQGDQPRGVTCIGTGRVLFAFDCPPGTICLVPRNVLVVVDLGKRQVIDIVDPYDAADTSSRANERSNASGIVRIHTVRTPIVRVRRSDNGSRSLSTSALPLRAVELSPDAADSLSVTFTVPEMGFRVVIDEIGQVFSFDGTTLTLTVSHPGTFQFTLRVNDTTRPNQSFDYTVATGGSAKTFSTTLDGSGQVQDTFSIDIK